MSRLKKAAAPLITPELEQIIERVTTLLPEVRWEQSPVAHPSDDSGLWFFRLPGRKGEVQIESSTGTCPSLIEWDGNDARQVSATVEEVVSIVVRWLSG